MVAIPSGALITAGLTGVARSVAAEEIDPMEVIVVEVLTESLTLATPGLLEGAHLFPRRLNKGTLLQRIMEGASGSGGESAASEPQSGYDLPD